MAAVDGGQLTHPAVHRVHALRRKLVAAQHALAKQVLVAVCVCVYVYVFMSGVFFFSFQND